MNLPGSAQYENESEILNEIINHLILIPEIEFKSQQRNELDLNLEEKRDIAATIFNQSKFAFLTRFGRFLKLEDLECFKKYVDSSDVGIELNMMLKNLIQSKNRVHQETRNRRYEALKKLIEEKSYFSETEMMKRNPLLYDELVGRYLTEEEMRVRDKVDPESTFVKILMEGIERDQARDVQKLQKEAEDDAMEEEDEDSTDEEKFTKQPIYQKWGEFASMPDNRINKEEFYRKENNVFITASERALLKEEFVSLMHQNFLEGRDEDFDYSTVDGNESYDNIELVNRDAEEKYFDSEEVEDDDMEGNAQKNNVSSEDELDIYMNALNQHPSVCALSKELKKL